jgi:DNA-directed RNA polymerase subunit RPC12/RpoP
MVSITDYTSADGKTDWDGYHAAQVSAGEKCSRCGAWIFSLSGATSGPRECDQCSKRFDAGEFSHSSYARCPRCRELFEPYPDLDEGEPRLTCPSCEHEFRVKQLVQVTYFSPALGGAGDDEEE